MINGRNEKQGLTTSSSLVMGETEDGCAAVATTASDFAVLGWEAYAKA